MKLNKVILMKWVPGTALLSWKKKVEYPSGFSCLHVVLSALKDIWTLCLCLSVLGVLACGSRRWRIVPWLLHYTMTQSGPLRGYLKWSVSSVLSQTGKYDRIYLFDYHGMVVKEWKQPHIPINKWKMAMWLIYIVSIFTCKKGK